MSDDAPGLSCLMRLLGEGGRDHKVVPWPGRRGRPREEGGQAARVGLWALGTDEAADAYQAAWDHFTKAKGMSADALERHPGLLDTERKVQMLFRALRHPDDTNKPFARSPAELRQVHPDEIAALFNAFVQYQDSRSPLDRVKTIEELEGQLDALGKGLIDEDFLNSYDSVTHLSIISWLCKRAFGPADPTKQPSSDTSPASDSSGSSTASSSPGAFGE